MKYSTPRWTSINNNNGSIMLLSVYGGPTHEMETRAAVGREMFFHFTIVLFITAQCNNATVDHNE